MRLTDFSRSSFLLLAAIQNTWRLLGTGRGITPWLTCEWYFRIPSVFFTVASLLQIIFIYARLDLVHSCVPKHTNKISFRVLVTFLFVWFVLGVVNQVLMSHYEEDGVCVVEISKRVKVIGIVVVLLAEVISFWFFYKPLRDTMLNGKFSRLRTVETWGEASEIEYYGMARQYTRSVLSEYSANTDESEIARLILQYTISVRRNFLCWVVTIFVSMTWFITFLLCEDKGWYWVSGMGDLQITVTMLIIYLSMIAFEQYWYKTFILC